jgi:hypothetical protein
VPAQEIPAELLGLNAVGSVALRNYSRNFGVFPVKIVLWRIKAAVERCDNFVHPRYMSFSPGTHAL